MSTVAPVREKNEISPRPAMLDDLDELLGIEQTCFSGDRLSRRSFKRHIHSEHSELLVAENRQGQLLGYGLIFLRKGTRLARLYSLAVLPESRGQGVAKALLKALEESANIHDRLYMRLEVAKANQAAIKLYRDNGFRVFGEYSDYYEDHSDALRMQKRIRHLDASGFNRVTPWYRQTTEFSCGPAALLMAMSSLQAGFPVSQEMELDIWREATTVFMTSGHGGTHPFGLALAARKRGFRAKVWVNTDLPLFLNGVRSEHKKEIMTVVHNQFLQACKQQSVELNIEDFAQSKAESLLRQGYAILVLISTYRLDGKKTPHWVTVTGIDDRCLYVHDPDLDEHEQAVDCQYVPIARQDFDLMAAFGTGRLRAAVAIKPL